MAKTSKKVNDKFVSVPIDSWGEFVKYTDKQRQSDSLWIYRGMSQYNYPLKSSLERAMKLWDMPLRDAYKIERQMIREFRRRYSDEDRDLVVADTLYCLALMQHFGAPTRLLDFTYSHFVAAYFALKQLRRCAIWAINANWLSNTLEEMEKKTSNEHIGARFDDERRNDTSFQPLYMDEAHKNTLVCFDNPMKMNERLITQQGTFLVPGNICLRSETNLLKMSGSSSENNVCIIDMKFKKESDYKHALMTLHLMNINEATLFPGLDGETRSLEQKMLLLKNMDDRGAGRDYMPK